MKNWYERERTEVNMGKTKVSRFTNGVGYVESTGKFPCKICKKLVGTDSFRCSACNLWIHKKCSSIRGDLYLAIDVKGV